MPFLCASRLSHSVLDSSNLPGGIKPMREPSENYRHIPTSHHHHHHLASPTSRVTPRTYPSPMQPVSYELKLPPTPRRQYWAPPPFPEDGSSVHRLSQRLRMERKRGVYVNSDLCAPPEHPNGTNRTSATQLPPPASWTQLLPYRVSTVPQNLSERLKKSETLPNDVWIQAQQSHDAPEVRTLTGSQSHTKDLGMVSMNGPRSPPPRPPMRTTSQKMVQPSCPVLSTSTEPTPKGASTLGTHNPVWLNGVRTSTDNDENIRNARADKSPILCRYSQLYSLPFSVKHFGQPPSAATRSQAAAPSVTNVCSSTFGGSGEATSDLSDMCVERLNLAS